MARIQDIQSQLESINETIFQDLCDELMHLEFSNIRMFSAMFLYVKSIN